MQEHSNARVLKITILVVKMLAKICLRYLRTEGARFYFCFFGGSASLLAGLRRGEEGEGSLRRSASQSTVRRQAGRTSAPSHRQSSPAAGRNYHDSKHPRKMCSLATMHCDYELLLSHSPPPPAPDFLCRPRYSSSARATPPPPPAVADPSRPCLSPSPAKHAKKRVVFADDKGYSLTQVRVMREPSFAPPSWSLQFLAQVTRDLKACAIAQPPADHAPPPDQWEPAFAQPASDYLEFRRRLDIGNVSLENVIVRDAEGALDGTVKVRNLSFHKEVVVRSTPDAWATHADHVCSYVDNGGGSTMAPALSSVVLYDTFSFRLPLPTDSSSRLEFCVCFRCDAGEFWDNNDGANYAVVKTPASTTSAPAAVPPPLSSSPVGGGDCMSNVLATLRIKRQRQLSTWKQLYMSEIIVPRMNSS